MLSTLRMQATRRRCSDSAVVLVGRRRLLLTHARVVELLEVEGNGVSQPSLKVVVVYRVNLRGIRSLIKPSYVVGRRRQRRPCLERVSVQRNVGVRPRERIGKTNVQQQIPLDRHAA